MQSIKLCSHVGADGILHLEIPVGVTDKEMEVVVIYQQIERTINTYKNTRRIGMASRIF